MQGPFVSCKSRAEAVQRCPSAVAVIKVEGGYLCFEAIEDYLVWSGKGQAVQ
jgi:hypothetical protein